VASHCMPRSPWISSLDQAGWGLISDRIIHGLCHDLSGRAGSISGLTFLLESQDGGASSVLPFLNEELAQLEVAVRLLRLLPDDAGEPELLAPGEIMEDLILLVRTQRGLENVAVSMEGFSQAPALRVNRTLFIRVMTVLLTGAAERVALEKLDGVNIRASGDGAELRLDLFPAPLPGEMPNPGNDDLPRQAVGSQGMRICRDVLGEEGVDLREVPDQEKGLLQLSFSSPSSS